MVDGRIALTGSVTRPAAAVRGRRQRVWVFALLGALLFSLTGISFLATSDALGVTIQPLAAPPASSGSTLGVGQSVKVTAVQDANFMITPGKAHTDSGRLLYKFEVNGAQSHNLHVSFMWTDPPNANAALKNGWMEVGLYYQAGLDSGSGCPVGQYSVQGINELGDGAQTQICVAPAADQTIVSGKALLTAAKAAVSLRSTTAGKYHIYLLASVSNNGNNLPPGQQGQLGTLKFYADATILGGS